MNNSDNYIYGTLNELLLSLHLSFSNTFPTSYKDEDMSPIIVHDKLKSEIGDISYSKINDHTYEMSREVKTRFINDSLMANTTDIEEIAWTSSPSKGGDSEHYKFTGVIDPNSDADIMLKTISGNYIGISAKYGVTKVSTLRTPGASYIERYLNISNLSAPVEKHNEYMAELGFVGTLDERKEQYKKIKGSPLAKIAEQSMLEARKEICRNIHDHLTIKSSDELKEFIVDLISPKTIFPHYRTQTISINSSNTIHKVYNIYDETYNKLRNYDKFYLSNVHNNTAYVTIYGHNKIINEEEPIIKYSAKNKSSPMKGWDGHVVSPMLNKRKKKNTLYAFDMDMTLFHYEGEDIAKIFVIDDEGNVVDKIDGLQLMTYTLPSGYHYDFSEFENSKIFSETLVPIQNVIDKMLSLHAKGKTVEIVTARTDFDDIDLFNKSLLDHGIDINKIHVRRCGHFDKVSSSKAKHFMFTKLINEYNYDEIFLYDDSESNLNRFLSLNKTFPNISLKAYHVKLKNDKSGATIKRYKND